MYSLQTLPTFTDATHQRGLRLSDLDWLCYYIDQLCYCLLGLAMLLGSVTWLWKKFEDGRGITKLETTIWGGAGEQN